ncbi:MAG: CotH kinase family protein [Alistipes sp.]|nr:CotH kinase family protein [Alistipes sp.]
MKPRVILLALMMSAFVACDKDSTDNHAPEARLKTVSLTGDDTVTIAGGSTAEIAFKVTDAAAQFDCDVASDGCQVSLRLADDTRKQPEEFALTHVGSRGGDGVYVATITDGGTSRNFRKRVCVAIKTASGELIMSAPVTVQNEGYASGITSMRLLKSLNPSLPKDIELSLDASTSTFTASIAEYQRSMQLIATFEVDGADRVEVGGVAQASGESVNDFRGDVRYTVYTGSSRSEYTVRITNFTGLPVMWVETPGGQAITSKEDWLKGSTLSIDGAGRFDDLESVTMSIRGRGNSTWSWPKKPYNIKLDSKSEILGMPKHKRWCLLANYMDRTLMRNKVAYYLAEQTSLAWTPRCEYVELFLNGEYQGQYLVAEHIKVDKNRVNITEMEPTDIAGDAVTGGYLLELDFHFDNVWQWHTAHNVPFGVKSPDDDELVPEQFAWIQNHIAEVEDAIYGDSFKDPAAGYRRYLDEESFADYWLVYELTVNHELGNPGSVFLHKDRGGKIVAGPVWDFDWGTFSYNASPAAQWGLFIQWAWWYDRLFQDEGFRSTAAERWRLLKPKFQTALNYIDEQRDYIAVSAQRNFSIWTMTTDTNGDERLSFYQAVDRMRDILEERIEIIDREISKW